MMGNGRYLGSTQCEEATLYDWPFNLTTRQDEANRVVCAPSHEKQFPFWPCNKSLIYQMFG